jgi:hypothetical protein
MAGEFEMAGLEDRMKHLDFKFNQDKQVMAAKWDAGTRALKAKLNVEVLRGRMSRNEAQQQARKFAESKRTEAMEFTAV